MSHTAEGELGFTKGGPTGASRTPVSNPSDRATRTPISAIPPTTTPKLAPDVARAKELTLGVSTSPAFPKNF
jgi:hypothetical protein